MAERKDLVAGRLSRYYEAHSLIAAGDLDSRDPSSFNDELGRVARSDTCADRDRERHLAARSALTGQTWHLAQRDQSRMINASR